MSDLEAIKVILKRRLRAKGFFAFNSKWLDLLAKEVMAEVGK